MWSGCAAALAGSLLVLAGQNRVDGQPFVREGMTKEEVTSILGDPHFGYDVCGDRNSGLSAARYVSPKLVVRYEWDKVIRVSPPYRAPLRAGLSLVPGGRSHTGANGSPTVFTLLVAAILTAQPAPAAERVRLTRDGLWETAASYLVRPGMTPSQVERLMGTPLAADTHGPPSESFTTYSYFWSGITVTFGPDERVRTVSGGYWR